MSPKHYKHPNQDRSPEAGENAPLDIPLELTPGFSEVVQSEQVMGVRQMGTIILDNEVQLPPYTLRVETPAPTGFDAFAPVYKKI